MKKILIPFIAFLCACSSQNIEPAPTSSTGVVAESADTGKSVTADSAISDADVATGATAKPNRTSFNGILVTAPQNHATVTLTMGGSVHSTSLLPGAYVKRGAVLASLENPEFITLQQTYLDSHAQHEYLRAEYIRQQTLSQEDVSSQKRFQQSKAEYLSMRSRMDAAAAQLALLGIDTVRLLNEGIIPYLDIKAPISGYVANVEMNIGKHFSAGEPFCEIVNKNDMMLCLRAYEKDLIHLNEGDRVEFAVNGLNEQTFHGTITMIGQQVNSENRSIEVYVRISEQNSLFRHGMYATAQVYRK